MRISAFLKENDDDSEFFKSCKKPKLKFSATTQLKNLT